MSTAIAPPPKLVPGEYTVAPVESGRWKVIGPDGTDPFPNHEFDDYLEAAGALILPAADEGLDFMSASTATEDVIKVILYERHSETEIRAKIPVRLWKFLHNYAVQVGVSDDDAIRKALHLLKIAAEANREGKRITIIDDKENYEQDITGIWDKNDVR